MSFPILEKCGTWASPVPRRSEKDYTGVDGWPCQPISLSLKLRNDFRALQNPFVGNHTSGMAKPRIGAFLRLLWLRCLKDKTSHRLQSENIADSFQSQTFDRRERKMSNLHGCPFGNLQCIASPMPLQDLLRIYHIRKIPNIATLAFDLNITYRAILNIELYKWQPQKRLQKLR